MSCILLRFQKKLQELAKKLQKVTMDIQKVTMDLQNRGNSLSEGIEERIDE